MVTSFSTILRPTTSSHLKVLKNFGARQCAKPEPQSRITISTPTADLRDELRVNAFHIIYIVFRVIPECMGNKKGTHLTPRKYTFSSTTSLHMALTERQLPLDVGSRGNRDIEAHYAEVAIGVCNHGKWVADVNFLDIFRHKLSVIISRVQNSHESHAQEYDPSKFVSIDNWEELLDNPLEVGVVRAHGTWQARLRLLLLASNEDMRLEFFRIGFAGIARQLSLQFRPNNNREEVPPPELKDDIDDVIPAALETCDWEDSDSDMAKW
jgi:hypothetical protein